MNTYKEYKNLCKKLYNYNHNHILYNNLIFFKNEFNEIINNYRNYKYIENKLFTIPTVYDCPKIEEPTNKYEIKYPNIYNFFIKTFPYVNHTSAKINSSSLTINDFFESKSNNNVLTDGYYDIINNKIYLKEETYLEILLHEFFHAYSTYIQNNIVYSGFSQFNLSTDECFFDYLCEAYNNLLVCKALNIDLKVIHSPYSFKHIIIIKEIVGNKLMEKLFFSNNTLKLVHELKKYMNYEEVLIYLNLLDVYYNISIELDLNIKKNKIFEKDIKEEIYKKEITLIENYQDVKNKKLLLSKK